MSIGVGYSLDGRQFGGRRVSQLPGVLPRLRKGRTYAAGVSTSPASQRSRARVDRICGAPIDARTLRLRLLEVLRAAAPFDAYVWMLTDPVTSVGVAPLADVPCLDQLPRLIGLKYRTAVNRWTGLSTSTSTAASLYGATGGQPSRSRLWRELLDGCGIGDVVSVVYTDRFGCWGFLDLWRSADTAPFNPDEIAFLIDTAPTVTAALRQCQGLTFTEHAPGAPAHPGPVVLMLSRDLEVLAQTPDTKQLLQVLVPATGDRAPIPASAYNVGAQLIATELGVDANPPTARVHVAEGQWVTLRAARIGDTAPVADRDIAVTIEQTSPSERLDLFSRAVALSPRESELVGYLAAGADTRELAARMHLSEHTVQDHLKSIFTKTGTRTRRALLTRALGT